MILSDSISLYDKATGRLRDDLCINEELYGSSSKKWRMGKMGGPSGNHFFACQGSLLCSWFIPPKSYAISEQIYQMPSRIISFQVGISQVILILLILIKLNAWIQIVVLRYEGERHNHISNALEVFDIKTGKKLHSLVTKETVVSFQLYEDSVMAVLYHHYNQPVFLRIWKFH